MPGQARAKRPDAVLFDLDGTLVDSERAVADALEEVLAASGRSLLPDERAFVVGHAWPEIHAYLERRGRVPLSLAELEDATLRLRLERASRGEPGGLAALPGARTVVPRISARVPCGLVTGSSRKEAELALGVLGLRACFSVICCAGEYARGKPAPDGYLLASLTLGVPPARCLVVEDSQAGIAAARAAGMFCIAVRAGNFLGQDQSEADIIVESLAEVDALPIWD